MEHRNYYELLKLIKAVTCQHPLVNNFYYYRYDAEHENDIEYPAVILTVNSLNVGSNITTASFNFMYVDRETAEEDNIYQVQSLGITIITEIVNVIRRHYDLDITENLNFQFFRGQFADRAAGIYCQVSILLPSDIGECSWFCPPNECEIC